MFKIPRGRIIEYEKFINDPQDTLMDIIYHLKQSGLELDINFEDIEIFIDKNYPQKMSLILSLYQIKK